MNIIAQCHLKRKFLGDIKARKNGCKGFGKKRFRNADAFAWRGITPFDLPEQPCRAYYYTKYTYYSKKTVFLKHLDCFKNPAQFISLEAENRLAGIPIDRFCHLEGGRRTFPYVGGMWFGLSPKTREPRRRTDISVRRGT